MRRKHAISSICFVGNASRQESHARKPRQQELARYNQETSSIARSHVTGLQPSVGSMLSRNTGVDKMKPGFAISNPNARESKYNRLLVFSCGDLPHGVRSTVIQHIDNFVRSHHVEKVIILTGDDTDGAEAYASHYAMQQDIPLIILKHPKRGGKEVRDWLAVQACDMGIGFSDEESAENIPVMNGLRSANKPTELWILGERGFVIKPWKRGPPRERQPKPDPEE